MYDIEKSQKKKLTSQKKERRKTLLAFSFLLRQVKTLPKAILIGLHCPFLPILFFLLLPGRRLLPMTKKKFQLGKGCVRYGRVSCPIFSLKSLFFFPFQREPGRRQTNRLYRQSILFLSFRDLPIAQKITKQKTIPGSCFFVKSFPNPKANARK